MDSNNAVSWRLRTRSRAKAVTVNSRAPPPQPLASSTRVARTSSLPGLAGNSFTITNTLPPAVPSFTPRVGAVTVKPAITGRLVSTDISDYRTFLIGGLSSMGVPTSNLAIFDGATGTYTETVATVGASPAGRTAAAAAYVARCNMSVPAVPKPCVVMVGGLAATGLVNDVWVLWTSETPMRWQLITATTAAGVPVPAGMPSPRSGGVGAVSTDGTTFYLYGGVTAAGPTADIFAFAPAGFVDPVYPSEVTNWAAKTETDQSSTLGYWGDSGSSIVVDGLIPPTGKNAAFDTYKLQANGKNGFACSHTHDEASTWVRTPWWRMKLNSTMNIDMVRVTPRSDCCTDRTRSYQLYTSLSNPNSATCWTNAQGLRHCGPPPTPAQDPTAFVNQIMPNFVSSPVSVLFPTPRPMNFLWFALTDLGYNRLLTLCQVEVLTKNPWVWRQLSGIQNVAQGKPATQNSFLTDWQGGDPNRAVDGVTFARQGANTLVSYDAVPSSCSHNNGAPAGFPAWWQVDLGAVYDVSQLRLFTSRHCCCYWDAGQNREICPRNQGYTIFVGNSKKNYIYDSQFMTNRDILYIDGTQTINSVSVNVPGSGGMIVNNRASGRYVTLYRPNLSGGDGSLITMCEVMVMAERLANQPSPVSSFASEVFRGNLVIYGGASPNGFRTSAVRFFNLATRTWAPAFTPLGTGPGSRTFAAMTLLDSDRLLIYGGTSNADVMSDMLTLNFATCPVIDTITGVQSYTCTAGGTTCTFVCLPTFIDQNKGMPVTCREDGLVDGILPPCLSTQLASIPSNPVITLDSTNTSVTVTWGAPSTWGAYPTPLGYRVQATPVEFFETYVNGFPNPGAWRQWTAQALSASFFYFVNGRLVMDCTSDTDYWAWNMAENMDTTGVVYQDGVRKAFVLYRDFPATIDPYGEWAMETEMSADAMPDSSGLSWGVIDMGLNNGNGEIQYFFGFRYTDYAAFGMTYTIAMETLGGRVGRIFPALSNRAYFRIEKSKFAVNDQDMRGTTHGVFRFYYKYSAGAKWVRIYETVGYTNTFRSFYNASTCNTQRACIDGPGMRWENIRPYFMAKSWNGNLYARARGSFGFLKITSGLISASQPTVRILPPSANNTQIFGLTRGVQYSVSVQALTAGGAGTPATSVITTPLPAVITAASIVFGTRVVSVNRPSFALTNRPDWGSAVASGNDGLWLPWQGYYHSDCGGANYWGVDLGVDYAAVKHIQIRNRADDSSCLTGAAYKDPNRQDGWYANNNWCTPWRLRHFSVYIGQDATSARSTNEWVDQALWTGYTSVQNRLSPWNGAWSIPNWPVRTISDMTDSGPNRQKANYNYAWGNCRQANGALTTACDTNWQQAFDNAGQNDPAFMRATIPTPGNGRYLIMANADNECFHFHELAVWASNSCPQRTGLRAPAAQSNSPVTITTGGQMCSGNSPFGARCQIGCAAGDTIISGTNVVTCNGDIWTGFVAAPVVCGPTCADVEPPAFTASLDHEIYNENFQGLPAWGPGWSSLNWRNSRIVAMNPIQSPLISSWAFVDGTAQALGRLGTSVEPMLVWAIEKVRLMDATNVFTVSATFSTDDRAGVIFRAVDALNYYRAYLDITSGVHVVEAVIGGVPNVLATMSQPLVANVPVTLAVIVSNYDMNVTINGRLLMEVSDRTFQSGYSGIYAQSAAIFTNARFSRQVSMCSGVTQGEKCAVTCQAGLISTGPLVRTCASGAWDTGLATPTVCTLAPPSFPAATVAVNENSPRGSNVGAPLVAQSSSPDYPVQFSLQAVFAAPSLLRMADTNLFSVDFCSGQIKVRTSNALDFEFVRQYIVTVRAYISGFDTAFTDRNVTININNIDEPPFVVASQLTYSELTLFGSSVGSVSWWDPENDTVTFTVTVDGSRGVMALDSVTGAFTVVARPSNSSGFMSMGTGPTAPLNFEGVAPFSMSVSIRQIACNSGVPRVACILTNAAAGSVDLASFDVNDPPYLGATLQILTLEELVSFSQGAGAVVGNASVTDEDNGAFASALAYTQVDPTLCGYSLTANSANWPTNAWAPPASTTAAALAIGTNNLFAVHAVTGEITLARAPSQAFSASTLTEDVWPAYVYGSRLVRANFVVCMRISDGVDATVAPVMVAITANPAAIPSFTGISPATFPTSVATLVTLTGAGFPAVGSPARAIYGNGVNSYNATGCTIVSATTVTCSTVIGVGGSMVWRLFLNNKLVLAPIALTASYALPVITGITGSTNMQTASALVTITGTNFGPENTLLTPNVVAVKYGPAYAYVCAVKAQSHTSITCTPSVDVGGTSLPYQVNIGGQSPVTTDTWSYAPPAITSVTVRTTDLLLNTRGGSLVVVNGTNFGSALVVNGAGLETTFGTAAGTLVTLPCARTGGHTGLTCTVPKGVGALHYIRIGVFGQFMTASNSSIPFPTAGPLSYRAPVIETMSGQGFSKADTAGNQLITISGKNFGPVCFGTSGTGCTPTSIALTYGSDGDSQSRFTATGCSIFAEALASEVGTITCLSGPGIGANLRYKLYIGTTVSVLQNNNTGGIFPELTSTAATGSYAAPNLISFSGFGAAKDVTADTNGNQAVVITGRNFGPILTAAPFLLPPTDSFVRLSVSGSYGVALVSKIVNATTNKDVITSISFTPSSCTVTVAHTEMECTTVPGAGAALNWDIYVGKQKSATPTTSYSAPIISSVTYVTGGATVTSANVDGGEWLSVKGSFFGPTTYSNTSRSLVQSISYGVFGTEYAVADADWVIKGQGEIWVLTQPGCGVNLIFRIPVADQPSSSLLAAVFSYALPSITMMTPVLVGTYSNPSAPTMITVTAQNLPLLDPRSRVLVQFGRAVPIVITPVMPQGAAAIAAARNPDRSINFQFALPTNGGGVLQPVQLLITPATSTIVAISSAVTSVSALSYRDPTLAYTPIVTKARFAVGNETTSLPACPFVSGPAPWGCDDSYNVYSITLSGSDFTSPQSVGLIQSLQRQVTAYDAFGAPFQTYSSAPLWPVSWTHNRIVVYTILAGSSRSGQLMLNLTSTTWTGAPAFQTLVAPFTEVSPDIGSITGVSAPFPTTGGSITAPVVLQIQNLAGARKLSVFVGNFSATLLKFVGGVYVPLVDSPGCDTPATSTCETALWAQAGGTGVLDSATGTYTVNFQAPPGQGMMLSVMLVKLAADGPKPSNPASLYLNYIAPVVTSVQTIRKTIPGVVTPVTGFTTLTVPTDGVSAVIRVYGTNLGVAPTILIGDGADLLPPPAPPRPAFSIFTIVPSSGVYPCTLPVVPTDQTCYEFVAPAGEGDGLQYNDVVSGQLNFPLGFRLRLEAGNQDSQALAFRYEAPTVSSVVSSGSYPTTGGVTVSILGENFGVQAPGSPASNLVVAFSVTGDASRLYCSSVYRVSHYFMNCTLPEGSGFNLNVAITVADLTGTSPAVFSYDRPQIVGVSTSAVSGRPGNTTVTPTNGTMEVGYVNPISHGSTAGGDILTIYGSNFGVWLPGKHCAFFAWSFRDINDLKCDDFESFLGEGEVASANIVSWSHTMIQMTTPSGLGYKDLELSIRGRTIGIPQYDGGLWRFVYNAPVLSSLVTGLQYFGGLGQPSSVVPLFDTEGGQTVTLFGANFGPTPLNLTTPLQSATFTGVSLASAPSYPTAYVGIVFHKACITDARTIFGVFGGPPASPKTISTPPPTTSWPLASCTPSIVQHTNGRLSFSTGAGIGQNRSVYVVVMDGPYVVHSNPLPFSYFAPVIESFSPSIVAMGASKSEVVDMYGRYFGNSDLAVQQQWSNSERAINVVVGGYGSACAIDTDPVTNPTGLNRGKTFRDSTGTVVFCNLDTTIMPAGIRNVSLTIAGQNGRMEVEDGRALMLVCAAGYYGRVGETCLPCPAQSDNFMLRGATCKGFVASGDRTVVHNMSKTAFYAQFTYPAPLPGWYNLNSSDAYSIAVGNGDNMLNQACPAGQQTDGRDLCIVPCDPPESCLGNNMCANGYTSAAPWWRCATCAKGFYKRSGSCIKCPDSPAALFIGFILLVVFVCCAGFFLNKKGVNVAVLSIGVDFFQVLAIFAQSRVKWPPIVVELLHVLSAFNLNIEIVAPE
jgi:hypothetical protein